MGQDAVFCFGAQIAAHKGLPQFRPVIFGPHDIAHLNVRISAVIFVVVMVHKTLTVNVFKRLATCGPVVAPVTAQQNRTTAVQERLAAAIHVTAVNAVGAPHRRLVRIIFEVGTLLAAVIPCRKQEVLAVMFYEACALDACATAVCDVLHLGTALHLARRFVKFKYVNARAPRAERHPDFSI